jgi:hypothetical protein
MSRKGFGLKVTLLVLVAGVVALAPAFGGSAVIGSVAGSMNATVGGQALFANTTIFSGDSLQVKDGVAIVAVGKTDRVVFGRDTVASFLRDTNEVTVLLGQGSVSLFHPDDSMALRVKVDDISVIPAAGFKTLGEVAMLGDSLVITTREGTLDVSNGAQTVRVPKGKMLTIPRLSADPQAKPKKAKAAKTGPHITGAAVAQGASVGLGGVSVVTSSVAMSRAGTAETNASTAASNAASALAAAQAASSAATAAASAASTASATATTICQALSPIYHFTCP